MAKTMIQIETNVRDKIKSLGKMGETYSDVLARLYKIAIIAQMENYLMDTKGYVDINEIM